MRPGAKVKDLHLANAYTEKQFKKQRSKMQIRCSVTQKWKFVVLRCHPGCEQAFSMNGPKENGVDFKGHLQRTADVFFLLEKSNWPILQHFTGFTKVANDYYNNADFEKQAI